MDGWMDGWIRMDMDGSWFLSLQRVCVCVYAYMLCLCTACVRACARAIFFLATLPLDLRAFSEERKGERKGVVEGGMWMWTRMRMRICILVSTEREQTERERERERKRERERESDAEKEMLIRCFISRRLYVSCNFFSAYCDLRKLKCEEIKALASSSFDSWCSVHPVVHIVCLDFYYYLLYMNDDNKARYICVYLFLVNGSEWVSRSTV